MGQNQTFKTFTANGTWVAPAGVTQVRIISTKKYSPFSPGIGGQNNLYLDAQKNIFCLGGPNANGELGIGSLTGTSFPTMVTVPTGLTFNKVIGPGYNGTLSSWCLALSSTGQLYSWGSQSAQGELGIGASAITARSTPTLVLGNTTFQDILTDQGGESNLALSTNGKAYAWGANANGQLGTSDVISRSSPVLVSGGLFFDKIFGLCGSSTNNTSYFGLTSAGALYSWGYNANGQLGVGDTTVRSTPTLVLGSLSFATIVVGANSVLGITTTGIMYAWGNNTYGELGNGSVTPRSSPVLVLGGLTVQSATQFSSGTASSYFAITTTGIGYSWGFNSVNYGILGIGSGVPQSSPVLIAGGLTLQKISVTQVIQGVQGMALALTTAGTVYAWGSNSQGSLGTGNNTTVSSPVLVAGTLPIFTDILTNGGFALTSFALSQNGNLYAWGNNIQGSLGVGTNTSLSSPVLVSGGSLMLSQPLILPTTVAVVPGTSYSVTLQQYQAIFGTTVVGTGRVDSVVLEYFE